MKCCLNNAKPIYIEISLTYVSQSKGILFNVRILLECGFAVFVMFSVRFCGFKIVQFLTVFGFCGFAVFNTSSHDTQDVLKDFGTTGAIKSPLSPSPLSPSLH